MIDPATALAFSMFENKGVYALLLGSGVSRAAQIPTGWEIVLTLTRRLGLLEGAEDQTDWAAWHQERFGEAPSYARLMDQLAPTAQERRALVHGFIEPTPEDLEEGRRTPTKAHHAIARLVRDGFVRVIITTNFDRLMENALREVGVEPTVIKSDDDLQGALPLIHTRCLVLKVHGDYLDTRLRNTEGELAAYAPALDHYLDRILDEHGLIVSGWSADWDQALRAAITRTPTRRFSTYWASRGEPSVTATELINHRGGKTIAIDDADSFFTRLEDNLQSLAALQRPNPQSTELLIASAKRFLVRTEHRIQLADLLADQRDRARGLVAEAAFNPNEPWSADTFRLRVARYEAIHEPLARVLFILGRWGRGEETELATDILRDLARRPDQNGQTPWLGLIEYPAVLAFYAYGLGLVRAGRLADLHRWLYVRLNRQGREETPKAVENLLLTAWENGGNRAVWRALSGFEGRRTPLSDHMVDVFSTWLRTEFPSGEDVALCVETFETFGTLAYTKLVAGSESLAAANASGNLHDIINAPIGRIGWNSAHQARVLDAVAGVDQRKTTLQAGFAGGDEAYLDLAMVNFKRLMSAMRHFG